MRLSSLDNMKKRNKNANRLSKNCWPASPGFSLVELVVSMTGGAAIFCLAIGTVQQTLRLSKEGSARAEHQLAVARLGQQFRSDVHRLSEFRLVNDASPEVTIKSENEAPVIYKVAGASVTREVIKTASSAVAREIYRLDSRCSVRFESADDQHMSLVIVRNSPDGEMLENRIVARTGRLFALQTVKKGQ